VKVFKHVTSHKTLKYLYRNPGVNTYIIR